MNSIKATCPSQRTSNQENEDCSTLHCSNKVLIEDMLQNQSSEYFPWLKIQNHEEPLELIRPITSTQQIFQRIQFEFKKCKMDNSGEEKRWRRQLVE